jgi:hypothetical protein
LNGKPVASVRMEDNPKGGFAAVEAWAAKVFEAQGGKAANPELGDVALDARSAKTSMAHGGANEAKKAAFAAVKDVIEKGAIVHRARQGQEDSFYISAPVDISGNSNVVTVLVRRDPNTQRMYLHSVTLKENLLNSRVSSADTKVSERSGSTNSGDMFSVLQSLLNFNPDSVSKVIDPETGEPRVEAIGKFSEENDDINYSVEPDETPTGHAQPLSARVLTPSGFKRMGDIHVGDEVITIDGGATPVTDVFPQGRKPIFRVMLADGGSTRCTADHLWRVREEGEEEWRTIPTETILAGVAAGRRYELPEARG